ATNRSIHTRRLVFDRIAHLRELPPFPTRPSSDLEEITKSDDILRKEPRAVTATIAGADLAVLGGGARHLDGACVLAAVERREFNRDGKRPLRRSEQRLAQLRIERGELLVGGLLGQIDVRPETFDRPMVWHRHARRFVR